MGSARRCVEILLDHHGGEPARAAEILHEPFQQLAGVRDVRATTLRCLRELTQGRRLDGLCVALLLLGLLAPVHFSAAHKAARVPLAGLLAAVVGCG